MPKLSLSETLTQLAEAQTGRSETSRLRDVFPEVERALAAGVRRQAILDALHQDGFTMNMKAFEKALYRIRKKAKESTHALEPPKPQQSLATKPAIVKENVAKEVIKKPHAFAGLAGEGRDHNSVHHSVPDINRIYDRN